MPCKHVNRFIPYMYIYTPVLFEHNTCNIVKRVTKYTNVKITTVDSRYLEFDGTMKKI